MSKFTLTVDCGIFGTFTGSGKIKSRGNIDVLLDQDVHSPELVKKVELMVIEYFDFAMTKPEQQIFNHEMHNPDHNKHFNIVLNKHFHLE